jgi:hypothetical protein
MKVVKRATATARKPPTGQAAAADDAAAAAWADSARGAAQRYREERERLVAQGVVDKGGKLLKARLAPKKPATTTDTRRW